MSEMYLFHKRNVPSPFSLLMPLNVFRCLAQLLRMDRSRPIKTVPQEGVFQYRLSESSKIFISLRIVDYRFKADPGGRAV